MSWDIPVSESFIRNVRVGVRRRRLLRRAVASAGAVLIASGGTALAVAHPSEPPPVVAPATEPALDGFAITWLPDGTTRTGGDSIFRHGLNDEDTGPGFGGASRRFDRGVGIGLFVCVLRPEPGATAEQVADWAAGGAHPVRTFAVPAGTAELLAYVGSETTTHTVVITTPAGVVITVEANGAFPVAEVESVARGIIG
jgi:hypothetical protein